MDDSRSSYLEPGLTPFERLCLVMAHLRSPEGCSWDRKQTHRSLLPYLIEECYEVVEAVEADDPVELREELGDLLCQIVFHAQLAHERGDFSIDDSVNSITDKLIRRHPHIFGDKKELNPDQVRSQWEKIKIESGEKKSVLSGLPSSMPALVMAYRMGEKAAGVGFDWKKAEDVLEKLHEELDEVKREIDTSNQEKLADEIGDLLFATASLARKFNIDPELALKRALKKFSSRFEKLEKAVADSGAGFSDHTLEQLEELWQRVK